MCATWTGTRARALAVFASLLASLALAATVDLDAARSRRAWLRAVSSINAGDTIVLGGVSYEVSRQVGTGHYGVVFKVRGPDGRWEALKLVVNSEALITTSPYSLNAQRNAMNAMRGHGAVAEVYEVAASGRFMRSEWIEGKTFNQRVAEAPFDLQRRLEIRRLTELLYGLSGSGAFPELQNIGANVIFDERRQTYVLIDPDEPQARTFHALGSTATRHLSPTLRAYAELVGFELAVRAGRYPEARTALARAGDPLLANGTPNPTWVVEYLRHRTHSSNGHFSDPGEILVSTTDWTAVSPARRRTLQTRMAAHFARLEVRHASVRGLRPGDDHHADWRAALAVPLLQDAGAWERFLSRLERSTFLRTWELVPEIVRRELEGRDWIRLIRGGRSTAAPVAGLSRFCQDALLAGSLEGLSYREALHVETLLPHLTFFTENRRRYLDPRSIHGLGAERLAALSVNEAFTLFRQLETGFFKASTENQVDTLSRFPELLAGLQGETRSYWARAFYGREDALLEAMENGALSGELRARALRAMAGLLPFQENAAEVRERVRELDGTGTLPEPLRLALSEHAAALGLPGGNTNLPPGCESFGRL